jgi:uncharacterized protein (TIGR00369 family)
VPTDAYSAAPHFVADLGVNTEVTSDTTARATLPVTRHITGGDGGVRVGVLATLVDMAGGFLGVRVLQPDWMATADLTIQVVRPATGPVVEARASVLRRGRTTLVIEATLYNVPQVGADLPAGAGEELVAWSTVTFAVLPASASTPTLEVPMDVPNRWSLTGAGFDVPVAEALLISVVDPAAGRVSMPKHRYLLNSLDAVQGGAMALVGEVAAAEALAAAGGTDVGRMVVTDLRVSYLTLGRVGPIVTRTRVLGAEPAAAGLSAAVELVDSGADDRVTTVIMVGAVALDDAVEAGAA